jgi:acetyl esterase/lipase
MASRWRHRSAAASAIVLLILGLLAAPLAPRPATAEHSAARPGSPVLLERLPYATDRVLDLYLPPGSSGPRSPGSPAVVLVHGCCGDRSDLGRLAEGIAAAGALVFNADWGGIDADAQFPDAFEDVACAVRFARARAPAVSGASRVPVVLAGWADGALAATVVAAAGDDLDNDRCRYASLSPRPDAVVGIAGFYGWPLPVPAEYDTARAEEFFGGSPDSAPAAWARATPYASVATAPPTVLLVGTTDVLAADARRYAAALRQARRTVRLVQIPPHGDQTLLSPRTAEGRTVVAEILATTARAANAPSGDHG